MECLIFLQKFCPARAKCSVLLIIVTALAVIGFQLFVLLPQSSIPSIFSSTTIVAFINGSSLSAQKPFSTTVDADVSILSDKENWQSNGSIILKNVKKDASKAGGKVSLRGETDVQGVSVDVYDDLARDGESSSTTLMKNLNRQRVNDVEPGGPVSAPLRKLSNHSSRLVTETSASIDKEKAISMTHQNASAMLWSSSQDLFELALERERGAPSMSMSEMNMHLNKNLASLHPVKPHWHSVVDKQISDAKTKIHNTSFKKKNQELYPFVFRNISLFMRSYSLMEQTLKVYIYPEGEKPVFHQPDLKGIYASEGWFMKLMKESRFHVNDPWKAHLFYLPFSSSTLRYTRAKSLHDKSKLVNYLKDYLDLIAMNYPFWNRTGGVDHFLASCHDWAPYMTKQYMGNCIRALCNADVSESFELGKDVSLPETYIHLKDPSRGIGGRPVKERSTFAFFTGVQNGYLRRFLLQLWENKDPDMKIFRAPSRHALNRTEYSYHMQVSKYCICPRGHEVNSPRVVEAILYECVPVIISDNFVPPFFEVLDWTTFSVFVAEKDIHRLKEILVSIPARRYLLLQKGVRKVQRHFLWHASPVKYDMFHMILHSVWLSRLNRIDIT